MTAIYYTVSGCIRRQCSVRHRYATQWRSAGKRRDGDTWWMWVQWTERHCSTPHGWVDGLLPRLPERWRRGDAHTRRKNTAVILNQYKGVGLAIHTSRGSMVAVGHGCAATLGELFVNKLSASCHQCSI